MKDLEAKVATLEGGSEMNNTLYEITDKYLKVLDNLEIDEETGEILNAEELDELVRSLRRKAKLSLATSRIPKSLSAT